jgi:hypothetical protein
VTEDDVVVLSALVSNDDFGGKLPRKWMGAFMILKQTLQRSREAGNPTPGERVRFVPKDS